MSGETDIIEDAEKLSRDAAALNIGEEREPEPRLAVLGGGAWGTALAGVLAAKRPLIEETDAMPGNAVMLYCRNAGQAGDINAERQNKAYLPNIILPRALWATADAEVALSDAEIVLAVFPAQAMRFGLQTIADFMPPRAVIVLCSKGLEQGSGEYMSQVARDIFPDNPIAILSGPSFAKDVAQGRPTAVTVAAETEGLAQELAKHLSSVSFRCYASTDIIGVELGGALKNVLALGAGMAAGRGLGASAQAALITRGFAELRRICSALGGRAETMTGLAVLGDLVLTCSSPQSRNYSYGLALARNEDVMDLPLAEGVATAPVAAALCQRHKIDAPLVFMVAAVLAGKITIDDAVRQLLTRPLKFED